MKGKIAVIDICFRCPYKFFDTKIGILRNNNSIEERFEEKVYCAYYGVYKKEKWFEITNCLEAGHEDFGMHKNCPLPEGDDFARGDE